MKNKKQKFFKAILSFFVIYHLLTVSLIPNPQSLLVRRWGHLFSAYASTLGLNTTWMFFSPSPVFNHYLEYEMKVKISDQEKDVDEEEGETPDPETQTYTWPPLDNNTNLVRINGSRLLYHSFLTSTSVDRVKNFLIPWLCRLHPEANSFYLRKISKTISSMEKAQLEGKNFSFLRQIHELPTHQFFCDPAKRLPVNENKEEEKK